MLIAPASLARTGVQTYRRPDGSEFREYRPESEVFAPAALESLRSAPVTIGHPAGDVTVDSLDALTVGLASDRDATKTQRDGQSWVDTTLAISRKAAIADAESGRLVEISLGYDADVDSTPGVTPSGERYDGVQRNIRINHVALLPSGQARAGRQARLRLDGAEETCYERNVPPMSEPLKPIVKIRLDGVEVVEHSPEHVQLLHKQIEAANARALAAETALTAAKADGVAVKAKADALEAELAAAKKPADLGPAVAAELKFRADALPLLPKAYVFDGKTREQTMRDAIGAAACARVDAQPEAERAAYLKATFDVAKPALPNFAPGAPPALPGKTDSKERDIRADADAMFGKKPTK